MTRGGLISVGFFALLCIHAQAYRVIKDYVSITRFCDLLGFHLAIITFQFAASYSHKAVPTIDALRLILCPGFKLINYTWFNDEGPAHRYIIRLVL